MHEPETKIHNTVSYLVGTARIQNSLGKETNPISEVPLSQRHFWGLSSDNTTNHFSILVALFSFEIGVYSLILGGLVRLVGALKNL
jgi:hypothetical protein